VITSRVGLLAPLRHQDFRRLAYGSLVSLLGDGFFRVSIAALVFSAGGDVLDLSKVAAVWAGAQIVALPAGGWASDRFERRRVMVVADVGRAVAIGALGLLGLAGQLDVWHIMALGALVGVGNGFFNPATISLVPDLLPAQDLERANAFLGFARPTMLWIVGPLLGGLTVQAGGPGAAMVFDAVTFLVSAAFLLRIAPRVVARATGGGFRQTVRDIADGVRFVRRRRWAWVPLLAGAVGTLAYNGSFDVLVPTLFTTELGLDERQMARAMSWIFAAGGVGSIVVSALIGQRGLPRRFMTWLFVAEALGIACAVGYGLMTARTVAFVIGFFAYAGFTFYDIAWTTTLQRLVPREMLGRVSSLDWFTSVGLAPAGFAIAGFAGARFGPRPVLITAGIVGSLVVLALMLVPKARTPQEQLEADRGGSGPDDAGPAAVPLRHGLPDGSLGGLSDMAASQPQLAPQEPTDPDDDRKPQRDRRG
jgi:MFS family permease